MAKKDKPREKMPKDVFDIVRAVRRNYRLEHEQKSQPISGGTNGTV